MPNPPHVLALDVGTSATRALLFDSDARLVPTCLVSLPNRLRHTADGGSEFEPQHLLENAIAAIDRALDQASSALDDSADSRIAAVTVATFAGNILGLDGDGEPITPVYTYADTRAVDAVTTLRREMSDDELAESHQRTGCLLHAAYLPARLRWLAETQPDLVDAVAEWVTIGGYLRRQFCGERGVSYSLAAWNGLLNRKALTWDEAWIERLALRRETLPPLIDVDQMAALQSPWSGRWGMLREAAWLPAIGDGAAANLGSGADVDATRNGKKNSVHQIALTIGSTAAMRMVVEPSIARVPDGLWLYRVNAARGLLGGATSEGGNVYNWLRSLLDWTDEDALSGDLTAPLRGRAPDAHSLVVLPFVAGERAPGWRAEARATLHGLALDTTPLDILQATLEAVAYRLALIQTRIVDHLPDDASYRIMAGGGALRRSAAWRQILADVLGHPIVTLNEDEITGRGLALLALEQIKAIDSTSARPPQIGDTHQPNAAYHAVHRERLSQQSELYAQIYGT